MPLQPPNLDDERYRQLLDELRVRVPVYAPEWTDHNESDPGSTLIQLLSWLAQEAGSALNVHGHREIQRFLRFLQGLGASPPADILRQFRAIRIDQWSWAKEPQVLAFLVCGICSMRRAAGRPGRSVKALRGRLAALLYLRQRISEVVADAERKVASTTPGATWQYMVLAVHWLLFERDWHRLPRRKILKDPARPRSRRGGK